MSTTIVGVFSSRQQAEEALYALRNQLESQNVAIIVRNEEMGTNQMSTVIPAENPGSNSMVNGTTAGTMNVIPTNLIGELTQDAMELGGTAGQLVGRVAALAATATFTLPAAMVGPMVQGMLGPMTLPGMTNPMTSMSPSSTPQNGGSQGTNQTGRGAGSGSTQVQSWGEKVVITIQANENLPHAVDILRNHGAREVNSYSA